MVRPRPNSRYRNAAVFAYFRVEQDLFPPLWNGDTQAAFDEPDEAFHPHRRLLIRVRVNCRAPRIGNGLRVVALAYHTVTVTGTLNRRMWLGVFR